MYLDDVNRRTQTLHSVNIPEGGGVEREIRLRADWSMYVSPTFRVSCIPPLLTPENVAHKDRAICRLRVSSQTMFRVCLICNRPRHDSFICYFSPERRYWHLVCVLRWLVQMKMALWFRNFPSCGYRHKIWRFQGVSELFCFPNNLASNVKDVKIML